MKKKRANKIVLKKTTVTNLTAYNARNIMGGADVTSTQMTCGNSTAMTCINQLQQWATAKCK
jgi:hypothetical protein